jgi:hypothetical protein
LSGLEFVSFYVAAVGLTFAFTLVAVVLVESPLGHLTRIAFEAAAPGGSGGPARASASSAGSLVSIKSLPSTDSFELSRPHTPQALGVDNDETSSEPRPTRA